MITCINGVDNMVQYGQNFINERNSLLRTKGSEPFRHLKDSSCLVVDSRGEPYCHAESGEGIVRCPNSRTLLSTGFQVCTTLSQKFCTRTMLSGCPGSTTHYSGISREGTHTFKSGDPFTLMGGPCLVVHELANTVHAGLLECPDSPTEWTPRN